MSVRKRDTQRGLTVMELLVVVGITAIIGGSLFTLLITSQTLLPMVSTRQKLIHQTNYALNYVADLLMQTAVGKFTIEDVMVGPFDDVDTGNDLIKFTIPYAIGDDLEINSKGEITWSGFHPPLAPNSTNFLVICLSPHETSYLDTAVLNRQTGTMLAWKDKLADLIIPPAYAVNYPTAPDYPGLMLVEYVYWIDPDPQKTGYYADYSWPLGTDITGVQFEALINGRIKISIQAEKTDWRGRKITTALSTEVLPAN